MAQNGLPGYLRRVDHVDPAALTWPILEQLAPVSEQSDVRQQQAATRRASLLGLPTELREYVYGYLFEMQVEAPPAPFFTGARVVGPDTNSGGLSIAYPTSTPKNTIASLLRTCRQIRLEVIDFARLTSGGAGAAEAELDLMVKGYMTCPTWRRLPGILSKSSKLDLKVNLRIFSAESFRANDGWPRQPGVAFRMLLTLLNQFLHCGPTFTDQGTHFTQGDGGNLTIGTLNVVVENHCIYEPDSMGPIFENIVRKCAMLADHIDAKQYLDRICLEPQSGQIWTFETQYEYDVKEHPDERTATRWKEMGFLLGPDSAIFKTTQ